MHLKAYVMWCHDDVRIEHLVDGIDLENPMNGIEWEISSEPENEILTRTPSKIKY